MRPGYAAMRLAGHVAWFVAMLVVFAVLLAIFATATVIVGGWILRSLF